MILGGPFVYTKDRERKIKSTIYLLHNECADVHTHNAEVRADTPRRCVVFNNVSFDERQSVYYATKKHHHQKPNKPFLKNETTAQRHHRRIDRRHGGLCWGK